jgi:hypothetical protein
MSQLIGRTRVLALALAVVGFGVGVSAAQSRQDGGITVYDEVNFQGASATFRGDVSDLRAVGFNDRISSLRMAPGETWEVCEDVNYGGRCAVISDSERDLRTRGWNDTITSMRRVQAREVQRREDRVDRGERDDRGGAGIRVYGAVNFQGASATFRGDVPDLRAARFNDRISSLEVGPGESWQICSNVNYGGRCAVVSGSERDLRVFGWNDTISSMRRVPGREGRRDRENRDEIVLFDGPNYRGAAQTLTDAVPGLGAFTNRAESAQILRGNWELCEEPRWGGRCVRISSSVPDLRRIGLRGVASARPLEERR